MVDIAAAATHRTLAARLLRDADSVRGDADRAGGGAGEHVFAR